jgi:hypothetical protein
MITDWNQACFAKMSGCGLQEGVIEKGGANNTYLSANQDNLKIADFCLKETITSRIRRAVKRRLHPACWAVFIPSITSLTADSRP